MFVFFKSHSLLYGRSFCLLAPGAKNLSTALPVRRIFYQSADCKQCHTVCTHEVDDENYKRVHPHSVI